MVENRNNTEAGKLLYTEHSQSGAKTYTRAVEPAGRGENGDARTEKGDLTRRGQDEGYEVGAGSRKTEKSAHPVTGYRNDTEGNNVPCTSGDKDR
jgi:hypothetical protein